MACGLEKLFAKSFPIGDILECSEVSSLLVCLGFLQKENRMHGERVHTQISSGCDTGRHPKWASGQEGKGVQSTWGLEVLFDSQTQERRMAGWHRGKILTIDISLCEARAPQICPAIWPLRAAYTCAYYILPTYLASNWEKKNIIWYMT